MKQLLLVMIIFSLIGCDSFDQGDQCHDDKYIYTFSIASLDIDTMNILNYYIISEGPFPVFTYTRIGAQCDEVDDDEWQEQVVFEIQTESLILELKDDELANVKCHYVRLGAWDHQFKSITSGSLFANNKNANEWEIRADLDVELDNGEVLNISFDETFQKE